MRGLLRRTLDWNLEGRVGELQVENSKVPWQLIAAEGFFYWCDAKRQGAFAVSFATGHKFFKPILVGLLALWLFFAE